MSQVLLLITIEAFREQKDDEGYPAATATASTAQQTKGCMTVIKCKTGVASFLLHQLDNAGKGSHKKK